MDPRDLRRYLPERTRPTVTSSPGYPSSRTSSRRPRILLFHGGVESSDVPEWPIDPGFLRVGWAWLRLIQTLGRQHVVVNLLRNRVMGWNGTDGRIPDPVVDARWLLERLTARHPDAPIVLVGHSMGARTAVHVADHPGVRGVVVLAPWVEPEDPVAPLQGRSLFMIQGRRDLQTPPAESLAYARRARAHGVATGRVEIEGAGHGLVTRAGTAHAWMVAAVAQLLGLQAQGSMVVAERMRGSGEEGLVGTDVLRRRIRHLTSPIG